MRYSVDAIIKFKGKFVVIKRLSFPLGLAFPGGGIEEDESKVSAVVREVKEETGLNFKINSWLPKIYNKDGRDPRWEATSFVAFGKAKGNICHEKDKTEVILLSEEEIVANADKFAFDHYQIFLDYLSFIKK